MSKEQMIERAREELERAGCFDPEGPYEGKVGVWATELLEKFAEQGHSGASAPLVAGIFERLARQEPLTPLTGEDGEWHEVGHGIYQNRRCSHVFREDGQAYDIQGRVFREPDGACFTSHESRVPVEFPYTPTTEYVDVPTDRT